MLKRQKKTIEKGVWMTTYSDMVTLLLCFFVLLYASSSIDRDKWQILIRSLNPHALATAEETINPDELDAPQLYETSLTDIQTFEELYAHLRRYIRDNNMAEDIDVIGGDGFTFITFRNDVLFDGDRYNLRPRGREVLDFLAEGVAPLSESIREMRILGHTNQADPENPNPVRGDRFLASNRATEVLVYIQEKNIIDPRKLVGIGYGQFYPVAPFVLEEDRLRNRRVEVLITETGAVDVSLEYIYSRLN